MAITRWSSRLAQARGETDLQSGLHPWRSVLFAPIGDGRRRRRGSDGVRLALAAFAVLCAVVAVRANLHPELALMHWLSPPPMGVRWLVDVFWVLGSFGTVAFVLMLAAVARDWLALRDLAAAAIGSLLVSGLLFLALGTTAGRPSIIALRGYSLTFPVVQIAVAVAVVTAALPYLARTVQRWIELVVGLAVLATVVGGQGLPVNVLGSMAVGWGVTATVHLVFGSPLGLPSGEEVRALLDTIGLAPRSVVPSAHQSWGVAHYTADMEDGVPFGISFYGRDATDAQLLTKLARFALFSHAGPMPAWTRVQQVEHESSITQLAKRAGARVPEVLVASTIGPSRDAVLITQGPAGPMLADVDPEQVTDLQLDDLFEQLLALRSAFISHGSLSPRTLNLDPGGWLTMSDFGSGTSAATVFALDQDVAGAIATLAISVGADRTAASASRIVPAPTLRDALAHLRRAGLDPSITFALQGKKGFLESVRTKTAEAAGIEVPQLVEPRRFSLGQLLVAIGTLVGGWALILVLINASHSFSTIRSARWEWVLSTALLCGASFLANAVSTVGSAPGAVPYGRAVGLEVSDSFTVLAAGGPAVAATQVRFFQQQGYDTTVAVTSGVLLNAANLLAKAGLFLVAIPVAWHSFHFGKALHQGGHSKLLVVVLVLVVVLGVALVVINAVPRWRRQVFGKIRHQLTVVRSDLRDLGTRPGKVIALFSGKVASQLLLALALGSALHAFDRQLSLAALLIAITVAGMLASASPAGGGMGVAEAGLILALTAGGIGKQTATAAVFVQRLFSAYLPPIAGWLTFMWMRRREYL